MTVPPGTAATPLRVASEPAGVGPARDVRLANESWEALLKAQASVMRGFAAERMWDELAITEYDLLYALKKAGCALRQTDLAQAVLLSQPALSRMCERLERRGLLRRSPDPADRRGVLMTLTDEGAAVQRRVGARHARSVETRMRVLDPEQQRQLRDLCRLLTEHGAMTQQAVEAHA